jgi:hypothetical protein
VVEPYALEGDLVVGGHAESINVRLTELSPQGMARLDSIPEPLRATLLYREQPVIIDGMQSCGEPAAVRAASRQLRTGQ